MKSKFFCAECDKEVAGNAESCPYCGTAFSGVRCPQCSFEGRYDLFKNGCPVCGHKSTADITSVSKESAVPQNAKQGASFLSRRFALLIGLMLISVIAFLIIVLFKT